MCCVRDLPIPYPLILFCLTAHIQRGTCERPPSKRFWQPSNESPRNRSLRLSPILNHGRVMRLHMDVFSLLSGSGTRSHSNRSCKRWGTTTLRCEKIFWMHWAKLLPVLPLSSLL